MFYRRKQLSPKLMLSFNIKRWRKAILLKCMNIAWDMWRHRNGVKHNTITPAKLRRIQAADEMVRAQYSQGSSTLLSKHRHWLDDQPLGKVLEFEFDLKQQWLESVEQARLAFQCQNAAVGVNAQCHLMSDWLAQGSRDQGSQE